MVTRLSSDACTRVTRHVAMSISHSESIIIGGFQKDYWTGVKSFLLSFPMNTRSDSELSSGPERIKVPMGQTREECGCKWCLKRFCRSMLLCVFLIMSPNHARKAIAHSLVFLFAYPVFTRLSFHDV